MTRPNSDSAVPKCWLKKNRASGLPMLSLLGSVVLVVDDAVNGVFQSAREGLRSQRSGDELAGVAACCL
jgi:hypothetical protein